MAVTMVTRVTRVKYINHYQSAMGKNLLLGLQKGFLGLGNNSEECGAYKTDGGSAIPWQPGLNTSIDPNSLNLTFVVTIQQL